MCVKRDARLRHWLNTSIGKVLVLMLLSVTGSLVSAETSESENVIYSEVNQDPLEKINRITHGFNDILDRIMFRPLAKGYKAVAPDIAQTGVRNFFANLRDVNSSANNILQGKFRAGLSDIGRVLINSTVGVGGLIDPATSMGLAKHNEDFGQTLRKWGVPKGPYLVMPFRGPSTLTDLVGGRVNMALNPIRYLYPVDHRNTVFAGSIVALRSDLLAIDSVVFGDEYIFYREAYLQRREYQTKDGLIDDDFEEF